MSIYPLCMRNLPTISPSETQCVRHVELFTDQGPVCTTLTEVEFVKEYAHTFRTIPENPNNELFNQALEGITSGASSLAMGIFSLKMFSRGSRVIQSMIPERFGTAFSILNAAALLSQSEDYYSAVTILGTASLAKELGQKFIKHLDPVGDALADPHLMAYH